MSIPFEKFAKWAKARFGEENVVARGQEVRINSIFAPGDSDYHLWCSPSGGKNKRKYGVFHCFKSDKKGSLVKLVQMIDSCDREDALTTLSGRQSIRELERQIEEMFSGKEVLPEVIAIPPKPDLDLPESCELLSELGSNNWWFKRAEEYLSGRRLPLDGLYICTGGKYKGRIVIPYYDSDGKLIYWNARHIGKKSKCKYLGPPKEVGIGKEDVLFMAGKWPSQGSVLYLCEGEFNAMSLALCELNSAACGGKNMSQKQAQMLSGYRIVICLDGDKAGRAGTVKMTSMISAIESAQFGVGDKLKMVTPPLEYNDWNEMLVSLGPAVLHQYVTTRQRRLDDSCPFGKKAHSY